MKKVCLITGVSSGIGERLCYQLVAQGYYVIGIARREERLQELTREFGEHSFQGYCCDTSDRQQVKTVSEKIRNKNTIPEYFFLNAGMGEVELTLNGDTHHRIFNTNYFGTLYWIEEWLWTARERGAQFVAVSSLASIRAAPNAPAYGASKAALRVCIDALRIQYRNTPVGFTLVVPGPVNTKMLERSVPFSWSPDRAASRIIKAAIKREKVVFFPWIWTWGYRVLALMRDSVTAKFLGNE